MSAPTGNTNATKWTEARTLLMLERIEKYAMMDHVQTLSRALVKAHIYKGIWTYWKYRWSKHEEIMDRICYIEQIFMMKIEEGGLSKRWHAGMCLFMLRVNYGQGEIQKNRKRMTDELPGHLVSSYDQTLQSDAKIQREKEEKNHQEEKEKAAKERAEKKAAKLKMQMTVVRKEVADNKPTECAEANTMSIAEANESVPVVDINRGRDTTVQHENDAPDSKVAGQDYGMTTVSALGISDISKGPVPTISPSASI